MLATGEQIRVETLSDKWLLRLLPPAYKFSYRNVQPWSVTQCDCPLGGETQEIYNPRAVTTTHRAAVQGALSFSMCDLVVIEQLQGS